MTSMESKAMPNAISDMYTMYFQVSQISLIASETTETAEVAKFKFLAIDWEAES